MKKIVISIMLAIVMLAAALTVSAQEAFTDVPAGSWYHDAVYYCVENKLFSGVTKTTFAPNSGMTRAMFVTVLASQHDFNRDDYKTSSFTDVEAGKWYSINIEWAYKEGLVAGMGAGTFAPDKVITRAQLVTLIRTYAEYLGYDMSVGEDLDLSSYKDAKDVPAWAQDGFKWAIANDIVGGIKSGNDILLAPNATATRATVALIMMKLKELPQTVPAGEAKMTIAGNDISEYSIIYNISYSDAKKAANDLAGFIKTATGVQLQVTDQWEDPTFDKHIYVGYGDPNDKKHFPETDKPFETSFRVSVQSDDMYFMCMFTGRRSTLYSVYYFAENFLGFGFYADSCIVCRPKANITIDESFMYVDGPAFNSREFAMAGGQSCYLEDDYYSWKDFVHGTGAWIDGSSASDAMPCLSSESNIQKVISKAKSRVGSKDGIWISINDSSTYCTCAACTAAYREDGTRAATMIRLCNRAAKEMPGKKIFTLAYLYTVKAPKVTKPDRNVVVYFCPIECCPVHALTDETCPNNKPIAGNIRDWAALDCELCIWDYATNFHYVPAPLPNFYALRENYKFYDDCGATGIFINSVYENCGEFTELRRYLYSQLMRYPQMTEKEYFAKIDGFIASYYGDEKLNLRKYIDLIQKMTEKNHFGYETKPSITFDFDEVITNIPKIDALWDSAYAQAKGDSAKTQRVDRSHISWLYLKQCATYEAYMINGSAEQKAAYKAANNELYNTIKKYGTGWRENGMAKFDESTSPETW